MDKEGLDFDLESVWPPAADLVALQFPSEEEFTRCRAVMWKQPHCYQTANKWDRIVVVRKVDLPLYREAGLAFTEVELALLWRDQVGARCGPRAAARVGSAIRA